jgi:hypothetical protein
VTDESLRQYAKEEAPTVSTDEGRKIDHSYEPLENAYAELMDRGSVRSSDSEGIAVEKVRV